MQNEDLSFRVSDKSELLETLKKSNLNNKVALALHSAAEAHGYKNTNLNTLELYLLDPLERPQFEKKQLLEPQDNKTSIHHVNICIGTTCVSYDIGM